MTSTAKPDETKPDAAVEGEGSYRATEEYNRRTRAFIDSGKVEKAAEDAAPRSDSEATEMLEAEEEGKSHRKGGDSESV
ncbi:MAG: hypothetical protein H7125_16365 [Proteobacteria bacterium]|nr:hypothetical protein [Burkholderiales bacterium]